MLEQHSFQEVMRQWARRCELCDAEEDVQCYVDGYICSAFCKMKNHANFKSVEEEIMAWAAEHPEPVYPTFGEWFEKQGIVKLVNSERYEEDGRKVYILLDSVEKPIPADIAEKLGLQPKEG